jgi:hypothetical protein
MQAVPRVEVMTDPHPRQAARPPLRPIVVKIGTEMVVYWL